MKEKNKDEFERIEKNKETFLYNIGYEHANNICEETDQLIEEYKDLEVPESLNEWFFNYQKNYDRKKQWKKVRKKSIQIAKQIAIIILMMGITFTIAIISVEAFRVRFFNIIIEKRDQFSFMKFEENFDTEYISSLPNDWSDFYYPEILPQDYKLKDAFNSNGTRYMIFSNSLEEELYFVQGSITGDFQLDSEDSNIIEVDINGMEGLIINKKGSNIISWHDNNHSYYIQGNVESSILIKVAESVIKN